MDVTPLIRRDAKVIQSYKGGIFKISNQTFESSVIVLSDRVLEWSPSENLKAEDFAILNGTDVELVLVGLPQNPTHAYRELRADVKERHGFAIDLMEIGAAARAYNALMAEGRRVAAALII